MKQGVLRKVISLVAVLILSVGLMTGCEERSNVPINPITGERDILDFDLEAIKINGEVDKTTEYAENNFVMKRKDNFPGWEAWKEENSAAVVPAPETAAPAKEENTTTSEDDDNSQGLDDQNPAEIAQPQNDMKESASEGAEGNEE